MSYYVIKGGGCYLVDYGEFWTRWVCNTEEAKRYASHDEAKLVAYAVEGSIEEVPCEMS